MRFLALLLLLIQTAAVHAQEDAGATLARIFQDEVGHWEGECVVRGPNGISRQAAVFDIVAAGPTAHRFSGRYGDAPVAGISRVAEGMRIDEMDGADAPARSRIVSAKRYAADDYHYIVRDDAGRSTIKRMGALQTLLVEPRDAPDRPARICFYLRTGPATP